MSRLFGVVFCVLVGTVSSGFSQERLEVFHPSAKIVWAVTNTLPDHFAIYQKVNLSNVLLSNVMAITSFKPVDIASSGHDETVFEQRQKNKLVRCLKISAVDNSIYYFETPTNYSSVENVPTFEDVVKRAQNYLLLLGGSTNEIAHTRQPRTEETVSNFDKKGGNLISKNVCSRGVTFNRQIDGIQVEDYFFVEFGSNAKIISLTMHWRNLRLYQTGKTKTTKEIISSIEKGQATIVPDIENGYSVPTAVKSLSITKVIPVYPKHGVGNLVFPSVYLEVQSNVGTVSNTTFQIQCAIISKDKIQN